MAQIYKNLILAGRKTYSQVPASLQNAVKALLQDMVARGELLQEHYTSIINQ
ncbi:MAG: CD1375 family protein [Bacteroidales bacterium]|nr:CD1375 family protein [Bacteroidales bacterium]